MAWQTCAPTSGHSHPSSWRRKPAHRDRDLSQPACSPKEGGQELYYTPQPPGAPSQQPEVLSLVYTPPSPNTHTHPFSGMALETWVLFLDFPITRLSSLTELGAAQWDPYSAGQGWRLEGSVAGKAVVFSLLLPPASYDGLNCIPWDNVEALPVTAVNGP